MCNPPGSTWSANVFSSSSGHESSHCDTRLMRLPHAGFHRYRSPSLSWAKTWPSLQLVPHWSCTIMSVYTYIYIIYIYIIHLHYTLYFTHYTCTYTYGCVYSHGLGLSISTYQTSPKKKSVAGDALGATTHAQEDFLFRLGQVQMMDRIILPIYMVPSGNLT